MWSAPSHHWSHVPPGQESQWGLVPVTCLDNVPASSRFPCSWPSWVPFPSGGFFRACHSVVIVQHPPCSPSLGRMVTRWPFSECLKGDTLRSREARGEPAADWAVGRASALCLLGRLSSPSLAPYGLRPFSKQPDLSLVDYHPASCSVLQFPEGRTAFPLRQELRGRGPASAPVPIGPAHLGRVHSQGLSR